MDQGLTVNHRLVNHTFPKLMGPCLLSIRSYEVGVAIVLSVIINLYVEAKIHPNKYGSFDTVCSEVRPYAYRAWTSRLKSSTCVTFIGERRCIYSFRDLND